MTEPPKPHEIEIVIEPDMSVADVAATLVDVVLNVNRVRVANHGRAMRPTKMMVRLEEPEIKEKDVRALAMASALGLHKVPPFSSPDAVKAFFREECLQASGIHPDRIPDPINLPYIVDAVLRHRINCEF